MRIAVHTWGSEGDVRPFFALADGLLAAGHEVRLAYCPADGRDYAARLKDTRFLHRRVSPAQGPAELGRLSVEVFSDRNPLRQLERTLALMLEPVIDDFVKVADDDARWAEVVVLHPVAHPLGAAALAAGKPFVGVHPAPMLATRAYPPPGLPDLGRLNRLAWRLTLWLLSRTLAPSLSRVRQGFGLAPVNHVQDHLDASALDLVAMSPSLLPKPADWLDKVHVSGFLSPRATSATLDPTLEAFLAAGPAPIFVSFGSMTALERDPSAVFRVVEDAVARVGCRAIVQSGGVRPTSARVLHVGPTPHDALFPRCAAVVHHGGVGTTQTAMRAGRPSVVVAHFTDQFMWGGRLVRLGVAPPLVTRRSLDAARLARAIATAVQDDAMQRRARSLGEAMQSEDGVARAVELIGGLTPRAR